jgi:hypothetical protein
MPASPAFAALRQRLEERHRDAAAAVFTSDQTLVLATGLGDLARALGGGFPRGAISTVEGDPSSGRSAVAARVLATATQHGLAALIAAVRAADIVLRSKVFGAVVMPAVPSSRATGSTARSRLASLAHRANAVVLPVGDEASQELRYFATVRLATAIAKVRWNGPSGHLGELAGYDVRAVVRKHKRAAPIGEAIIGCETYEDRPLFEDLRERTIARESETRGRLFASGV